MSAHRPPIWTTLQGGRGLASLLVVLFHASGLFLSDKYWKSQILYGIFGFGHAGVEFFFALSGFIMILIHRGEIGKSSRFVAFLVNRGIRIYPIYWVVTAIYVGMYLLIGNNRLALLTNSIFLFGISNESIIPVAWTLFHEVVFYLVFSLLILNKKLGIFVITIWFSACLFGVGTISEYYIFSPINLVFGFGMLAGLGFRYIRYPVAILIVTVVVFISLGVEEVYYNDVTTEIRTLAYGAASSLAIASAVSAEMKGLVSFPRWITRLGDSSYSLYLIHYPVLAIAAQLWLATSLRTLPVPLAFFALVCAAIVAGLAIHWLIEKPMMTIIRKKLAPV